MAPPAEIPIATQVAMANDISRLIRFIALSFPVVWNVKPFRLIAVALRQQIHTNLFFAILYLIFTLLYKLPSVLV